MDGRKATSDEWVRYYAETVKRGQHGRNDPVELQRSRALIRERLGVVLGLTALATALVTYVVLLAP